MKTAEAHFRFPVLGFTPDHEIWGFQDLDVLTSCGPRTLRDDMQTGMELIDADGHRWIVRSVRRTGRGQPLIPWLVSAALTAKPLYRIEHELDALQPVSLSEAQERACASLQAFPEDYCADDERETVLEPLLAQVRAATTITSVHELLGLDDFRAY